MWLRVCTFLGLLTFCGFVFYSCVKTKRHQGIEHVDIHPHMQLRTASQLQIVPENPQDEASALAVVYQRLNPQERDRPQLILQDPQGQHVLSQDFFAAQDPALSFDGERMLFSARKSADDVWNIYEMTLASRQWRQVVDLPGHQRYPFYQSTLYVITSELPWQQIAFTSDHRGVRHMYSARLDGQEIRQLTYHPLGVQGRAFLLKDGRLLFAGRLGQHDAWQSALFTINLDGTEYSPYGEMRMAAAMSQASLGDSGRLLMVTHSSYEHEELIEGVLHYSDSRRRVKSSRVLKLPSGYVAQDLSPVPGGQWLLSLRHPKMSPLVRLYRYSPSSGDLHLQVADVKGHVLGAQAVVARTQPDGRSSVVNEAVATGQLYVIDVYNSDEPDAAWVKERAVAHIRVLQATESKVTNLPGNNDPAVSLAYETIHVLGDVPVHADGSINIVVPANTSLKLQALNKQGDVIKSCDWIWLKNKESRGCIGCHEDNELSPDNIMPQALWHPPVNVLKGGGYGPSTK